MSKIEVRRFTKDDLQQTGELYHKVTSAGNAVFWWVGEEDNWSNVFIAIEGKQIIAKGQVSIITTIPLGSLSEHAHQIYLNIKTLPERENDYHIYNLLYEQLLSRAYELKNTLPSTNTTIIGVGNQATEKQNNNFFISKGFTYTKSLFTMRRSLTNLDEYSVLLDSFRCYQSKLTSNDDQNEYLEADMEIWPDAPIGLDRLLENQQQQAWTAFIVRKDNTLIGSVMTWVDEDGDGIIEDVFVRAPWRKLGVAKYLIGQALTYLKSLGYSYVELQVETANKSALSLYQSVGFKEVSEEMRFHKVL